jgi:rhodanese-related sulfurtransferase
MNQSQINFYENKLKYEIDSWDLFEAQKNNQDIVVLDMRSFESYKIEHIVGAISFPHSQIFDHTTNSLSKDKNYVVYCDGIGCNASTTGALKMSRLGFNVRELIGGLNWWIDHNYPTNKIKDFTIDTNSKDSCSCE